jgi:hypothetical protein
VDLVWLCESARIQGKDFNSLNRVIRPIRDSIDTSHPTKCGQTFPSSQLLCGIFLNAQCCVSDTLHLAKAERYHDLGRRFNDRGISRLFFIGFVSKSDFSRDSLKSESEMVCSVRHAIFHFRKIRLGSEETQSENHSETIAVISS